jgi:hypothetical protein
MKIADYIKLALAKRYPTADFKDYFEFLESIAECSINFEKHHILPVSVKTFYQYRKDPNNLLMVSAVNHDKAHKLLGSAEKWLLRTARRARGYYQ